MALVSLAKSLPAHLSPAVSAILVAASGLFLTAMFARSAWLWLQNRRWGRAARRALDEGRKIAAGPIVLAGRVDSDLVGGAVARVELEQVREAVGGTRPRHGGTDGDEQAFYVWREVGKRQVTARPFTLTLESGERVQVEPGTSPVVVDELELGEQITAERRRRMAQVLPGQTVHVVGELVWGHNTAAAGRGGYRDAGSGWVMRAPRDGSVKIASAPLEQHYAGWGSLHARLALVLAAVIVLGHGLLLGTYHRLGIFGQRVMAQARYVEVYGLQYVNRNFTRYRVKAALGDQMLKAEIPPFQAAQLSRNFAARSGWEWPVIGEHTVALRLEPVPADAPPGTQPLVQYGAWPSAHGVRTLALLLLTLAALGYAAFLPWWRRPWFERAQLVDRF
jgi:hypothetical protein